MSSIDINTNTATDLRQRVTAAAAGLNNSNSTTPPRQRPDEHEEPLPPFLREPGYGISAKGLIEKASPQHHGVVLKLHVPVLYSILPSFLQNLILKWTFLANWFAPRWKQRYLIVCGSYVYKFKDRSSSVPKGSPIDVETINIHNVIRRRDASSHVPPPLRQQLPPNYGSIFCISTFRKNNYYAVVDEEEASVWIRTLEEARQEAITRRMGHSQNVPYPKAWSYYDSLGKALVRTKERVRNKIEESRLREMELTDLGGIGGPGDIPRGYHG